MDPAQQDVVIARCTKWTKSAYVGLKDGGEVQDRLRFHSVIIELDLQHKHEPQPTGARDFSISKKSHALIGEDFPRWPLSLVQPQSEIWLVKLSLSHDR